MFNEMRQEITVIPKNAGYYGLDGLWVETDDTPFVTLASVQPLSGRDMEMLPEGRYTEETFRLYADIRLHAVSDNSNPDIVILGLEIEDVDRFEVKTVFPWQNKIIPHYKMIIAKTDPDEGL
jgi:hypothetical protein